MLRKTDRILRKVKPNRRILTLVCLLFFVSTQVVQAAQSDLDAVYNWPLYNPGADCPASGTTTTGATSGGTGVSGTTKFPTPNFTATATNNDLNNAADIMQYLHDNGFSWIAAAGAVAAMWGESEWNPEALAPDGARGIIQWTPGSKLPNYAFTGNATHDMNAQLPLVLQFIVDSNDQQYVDQMNKATSVADAANIFGPDIERFLINDVHPQGIQEATQVMNNLMNGASPTAGGTGVGSGGTTTTTNASCCASAPASATAATTSALGTFSSLTGDALISGTFILGFDAHTSPGTIQDIFKKYKPAGIYLTGTTDAAGLNFNQTFYQALAADAGHPIVAASDEEGGQIHRYSYNFSFPSPGGPGGMSSMTANNFSGVKALGQQVGNAMKQNGLNTDLAPVLDVATDSSDTDTQLPGRSFSDNPNTVAAAAGAFAAGLKAAGINPTYKHFPGLGSQPNRNTDSGAVTTTVTAKDLSPYTQIVNQNGAAVMMDNAYVRGLINTGGQVASTSATAVSALRNQYNFTGLVMADDITKAALDTHQSISDAIVASLKAGVDAPLINYGGTGNATQADLDAAITKATNPNTKVNTTQALQALDTFTAGTAAADTTSGNSCCGSSGGATTTGASGGTVQFYDSTTPDKIPGLTTANAPKAHAATYSTGNYGATAANYHTPIKIAQRPDLPSDKAAAPYSNALDFEPGIADPSYAAPWVEARAKAAPSGIIILYTMKSWWPAVQANVATLPANLQSRIRYWIADITGTAQVSPAGAWGTQYNQDRYTGLPYDNDVTTQGGWDEVLASPPQGTGSGVVAGAACDTTTTTTLTSATLDSKQIAQQIIKNKNNILMCGRLVQQDLQDAAAGKNGTAGAPISINILRMIADVGAQHKVCVDAIESGGTGHTAGSEHYKGHAVDFGSLDGVLLHGRDASSLVIMGIVEQDSTQGAFGQQFCGRPAGLPSGWTQFDDTCDHLHVQDVP